MEREELIEVAELAIAETGYPTEVADVARPQEHDYWFVIFTNGYGRFYDKTHDFATGHKLERDEVRAQIIRHLRGVHERKQQV